MESSLNDHRTVVPLRTVTERGLKSMSSTTTERVPAASTDVVATRTATAVAESLRTTGRPDTRLSAGVT